MAGATLTTLDKVLKEFYIPPIQDQFNKKKVLLAKIKRGSKKDVVGKSFIIPVATQRHYGNGARAEDATLPAAGNVTYSNMAPAMRYNYAKVRVTGQSVEAAKSDRGSFVRALDSEIKGAEEGLLRSVNRQLNGEGSGILAICDSTTTNSLTVAVDQTRNLEVGMLCDVRQSDDGTASGAFGGTSLTIASITAGASVTFDAVTSATSAASAVYIAGNRNIEMMGVLGIVNDQNPADIHSSLTTGTGRGTLQGLDVSNSFWKATRNHNSGTNRDISIDLLTQLFETVDINSGKANDINMLYSRHGQWRKYGLLLQSDRRYGGQQMKLDGGFKTLEFDGVPWFYDRDCWPNRVFAMNSDDLKIFEMAPINWASREGHILKWESDKDAWIAWLYWYAELGVCQRFCHGVLEDLSE